jgi:cyclophilin family peptidyl-prolyl cis-trans isomerase/HEAT repeat protein
MRKLLLASVFLSACTAAPPPQPAPAQTGPPQAHGLTIEEEALILALEDRREFDPAVTTQWVAHPNALHRLRIVTALGRIGPHTFVDANGNRERDPDERQAGVAELTSLISDVDSAVRTAVAFALGEIGDKTSIDALFTLTADANASVAAEAAEALSKMAANVPLARYTTLTNSGPEGVRARAIRYLFRFNTDEASAVAAATLESGSKTIREESAYALARRAYAPARERLELLFNDNDALTRSHVVAALGRIAAPQSIPTLTRALGDIHPWVRANAAVAMARVGAKDATALQMDTLPRIIALTEDADPGTRTNSIDLLGYYAVRNETARKRLTEIATNGSRWERELATAAIAKQYGDSNLAMLPTELTGWSKVRIIEAAAQLKKNGAALRKRFAGDNDHMVRMNAIGSIPDESVDAEIALIRPALDAPDPVLRANALERFSAAKSVTNDEKIRVLTAAEQRAVADRENDARIAAIRGLAAIDYPGREATLRGFLGDKDPMVRRAAADLIEEQLKRNRPQYTPLPVSADYTAIATWARQPHTATIHMTRGVIDLILLPQDAPRTAWNFAQLAQAKYFDNSTFMRVVPNFVIQGGDPRNDQNGGPGYSIRDEINQQKYTRGAVGMALSGPDTGGSQFFITHSPQPHLDGGYTIFARVTSGMNSVIDQTERGDRVETITIDEKKAADADPRGAQQTPLPLTVGRADATYIATLPEYSSRRAEYQPDTSVVEMIAAAIRPEDRVEVYMGTWCDDSQREVPRYLKIADILKEKFSKELPASFITVDRSKTKPEELLAGKNVEKVATFVYYRGDQELGRIVEKPTGLFEDDLLVIVSK